MDSSNKTKEIQCCVTSCERPLDKAYWNDQWINNTTGWDIGYASPAIVAYLETIQNKDLRILIPGCGNAYEASYLVGNGFTNITFIDIAPKAVENLQEKFKNEPSVNVLCEDFFQHEATYDLIIEQTFLSALPPLMRPKYVWKMWQLLAPNGVLAGLLFNRWFELDKPPFGGSIQEYESMFKGAFQWTSIAVTDKSIEPRKGSEVFIELHKNAEAKVNLYAFSGITCNGCMTTVTEKILKLDGVVNVQMSSDFSNLFIVSDEVIELETLQELVSYDEHYKIVPFQ